jgi:hypothetical protein
MAINIMYKDQKPEDILFKALLDDYDLTLVQELREKLNVQFKIGFYDLEMTAGDKETNITFPVATTSILKGSLNAEQRKICASRLQALLGKGMTWAANPDIAKAAAAEYDPTNVNDVMAKQDGLMPEAEAYSQFKKTQAALKESEEQLKTAGVDLDKPIPLREATKIGQAVRGTDAGSVYHVIGLSDRLKIAARRKPQAVSLRVEGDFLTSDISKLTGVGFQQGKMPGGKVYFSMHVGTGDVPLPRIVGSILFGSGIEWTEIITNYKQIKEGA